MLFTPFDPVLKLDWTLKLKKYIKQCESVERAEKMMRSIDI